MTEAATTLTRAGTSPLRLKATQFDALDSMRATPIKWQIERDVQTLWIDEAENACHGC
jgi:hypothetical protein